MHDAVALQTAAIASGDTQAFAAFYRTWFDHALQHASQCTGRDEQFCLDVVHDAMVRVIRSIRPMKSKDDVARWLRAVVKSCAYDRLRRESRRRRREHARADPRNGVPDASNSERLAWLRQQLAELDPEQMRLIAMRYRLGWTLERIGGALGLKPGAVDGRLSRLLATLRRSGAQEFSNE